MAQYQKDYHSIQPCICTEMNVEMLGNTFIGSAHIWEEEGGSTNVWTVR